MKRKGLNFHMYEIRWFDQMAVRFTFQLWDFTVLLSRKSSKDLILTDHPEWSFLLWNHYESNRFKKAVSPSNKQYYQIKYKYPKLNVIYLIIEFDTT